MSARVKFDLVIAFHCVSNGRNSLIAAEHIKRVSDFPTSKKKNRKKKQVSFSTGFEPNISSIEKTKVIEVELPSKEENIVLEAKIAALARFLKKAKRGSEVHIYTNDPDFLKYRNDDDFLDDFAEVNISALEKLSDKFSRFSKSFISPVQDDYAEKLSVVKWHINNRINAHKQQKSSKGYKNTYC